MKPSEFSSLLPPSIEEKISNLSNAGVIFLTEPNSSSWAWRWSFFMCTCTLLNVIFLILASMDGPNNYEGRVDMSTYPTLFNEQQYILGGKVVWTPMCFDALMRILSVSGIFLTNEDSASDFSEDTFKVALFFMDVLSVIPFTILSLYYYPKGSTPVTFFRLLFRVLELFSCAKILRGTKDLPAVLAIRITLSRAIPHLILPIFFFLVFNIFFGVVVYFMEPCYNYSICAWADLFEASFYSVVSMTTTGYGNQVPNYLPARFIGVIVMLFGSVFMSMPLAIIGNEYGDAWSSLKAERSIEAVDNATETLQKTLPLQIENETKTNPNQNLSNNNYNGYGYASTQDTLRRASSTEVKKEAYTLAQQALLSPLIECRKNLDLSVSNLGKLLAPAKKMNPAILLAMCELRGWIAPLLWNIRVAVEAVDKNARSQSVDNRKLSVFRTTLTGNNDQSSSSSSTTTSGGGGSNAPLSGLMRPNIKASSNGSNLGALQENPEEDDEKELEDKETIPTTSSHHNLNAITPLPPIRKGRAPTTHPNASSTKSHLNVVKRFLATGMSTPSRVPGSNDNLNSISNTNSNNTGRDSNLGIPMRPSFWPLIFWGTSSSNMNTKGSNSTLEGNNNGGIDLTQLNNNSLSSRNKVDNRARISPLPPIQQHSNGGSGSGSGNNSNSNNDSSSEDEKLGEEIVPAEMVLPGYNNRQTIPKGNGQDLAKQIKLNQINSAVATLQKQPSFVQKMITKQKSMESMTFIVKLAKAAPDIAKMRGDGTEFTKNMERAVKNPKALRTKLWMLMELPSSSRPARFIQIYLIILIMLSVLVLYTETLPSFSNYSEDSPLCGQVLDIYCSDKHNITLDPGCFVQNHAGPTNEKLKYGCSDSDCFAHGYNYGARWSNMTCASTKVRPFQTLDQLIFNFRAADFTIPREKMHKIQDVCFRIECRYDSPHTIDGNIGWIPLEILINLSFTIEILLRILVSFSWSSFFLDFMNIFDILSVVPFYIDIISAFRRNTFQLDFSIIASSPAPIILVALKSLKVFRLFKMTRHFSASQVLFQTANNAWKQILGMLSLLVFIVTIFALLLYEVEKGHPCYFGDSDCEVPDDVRPTLHDGQEVWISKTGELSKFASVLDSLWFSVVTLTSTGYGDMVPVTNLGQTFSIFLMLFGAFYMSMPLTVVATTFWESHQNYLEKQKRKKRDANKKLLDEMFLRKLNTLENALLLVTKKLDSFFTDIQQPNTTANTPQVPFLDRCSEIQSLLINLMRVHDPDIKRLSVVYTSHVAHAENDENSNEGSALK